MAVSRRAATILAWFAILGLAGCLESQDRPARDGNASTGAGKTPGPSSSAASPPRPPVPTGPFKVESSAFRPNAPIPREHSCDGANVSPPLNLTNAPLNTSAYALIMEDPDAPSGTVLHWTFWNLRANETQLPRAAKLSTYGAKEGQRYRGPCPPIGEHRYFFYAYGLDGMLGLTEGSSVGDLRAAMRGHVTATAQMYGTYFRPALPPI